ncbi:hypothetical protein HDU83_009041 [Entophlyctis luteolus]|nr:hypothetical protein HDU83_009041 [Entophlyctis luteolus]
MGACLTGRVEGVEQMGNDADMRNALVEHWTSYFKSHDSSYSDASKPIFPHAYQALTRIPAIFDTLMDLEHAYSLAVAANLDETRILRQDLLQRLGLEHNSGGAIPSEIDEQLMIFDALRESLLIELRHEQKAEYQDFVLKIHNELLLLVNQPPAESATVPFDVHFKNADALESSFPKLIEDGTRAMEGAVGKMRRMPSESMMKVGSLESLIKSTPHSRVSSENQSVSSSPMEFKEELVNDQPISPSDLELIRLTTEIEEMGFSKDQANAALSLSNRDVQNAIITLLENPDRVEQHIQSLRSKARSELPKDSAQSGHQHRSNSTIPSRKPQKGSTQTTSLHKSSSSSSLRRSHSNASVKDKLDLLTARYPNSSPLSRKQTAANGSGESIESEFSPLNFIQQQQAKISSDFANVAAAFNANESGKQLANIQKGFTNFLGKAMEALHIDPTITSLPVDESTALGRDEEMSESFTAYFGTQVQTMYTFRVTAVPSLGSVFLSGTVGGEVMRAVMAQTAAGLYSDSLSGCVLLVKKSELFGYGIGKTANQDIIRHCKQRTEFHFDDIELQLKKAIEECPIDNLGNPMICDGDFFVTRHSNIPEVHVLFHLIIPETRAAVAEFSSQTDVMLGYRNILKLARDYKILNLTIPVIFQPAVEEDNGTGKVVRQIETIFKCTRGAIIEDSRSQKHSGENAGLDKRSGSYQFALVTNQPQHFQAACEKLSDVFKIS